MDTGLVVGIVSCTVPLLMMLLMILSARKESNNACYSPLFIRLLILSIFLLGIFFFFSFQRIIDSVLACIPIIFFFVALFAFGFTQFSKRTRFERKSCPISAKIGKLLKSDTKSPSDRVLFRHWFSRTKKKGMPRFETFPEFAFT